MNYKEAKTEANTQANLTGVNHVIVNIDSFYNVYTEKEYPKGYLELVKPVERVTEIETSTEVEKPKKNVSKKA